MKNINIKKLFDSGVTISIIILAASVILIYLLLSLYFSTHFFFNTVINGADVSLKAHDDAEDIIINYTKGYRLQLIERDAEMEEITGQDIGMQYNRKNSIYEIYSVQKPLKWIGSLIKAKKYYVEDLFSYNEENLGQKINELNCLNKDRIEPQNVSFEYSNGLYAAVKEVYGNRVNRDKLNKVIETSILKGAIKLDLDKELCYENPKYTLTSDKTFETLNLLNKYVSTNITYMFGSESETLDGNIINHWLSVDENLEAVINEKAVGKYVQGLGRKYNTAGATRSFKTSIGKIIEVEGGFYGWKINSAAETKALLENIKLGEILEKEPVYSQKALSRGEDEIGNTYVEINITRQHLWFYKEGKLVTQGDVVTGDVSRGYATELGTYMLNYKQKGSILRGPNYEAEVNYWMPFNGNIGIHDASWRHSFGGNIYKSNGTHGCVNTSLHVAKKIFEHIEEGTPIICYKE